MNEAMDAVITWVDGYDEAYKNKLTAYLATLNIKKLPEGLIPTRFNQQGELNYCIHSLLHFAPWLRTLFIVTDGQTPTIIHQLANTAYKNKIRLVDHREIFDKFENCLPNFNSLAIESVLWRIEGLSERFIYFNDDCFLIRPVQPEDFFRDQQLVLRGRWKKQSEKKWFYRLKRLVQPSWPDMHRKVQENSAQLVGWKDYFFQLPHMPFPLRKSTLEYFFQQHPTQLVENIRHRWRNQHQFWPISLAQHLEIKKNNVFFAPSLDTITINPLYHNVTKIQQRLALADQKQQTAFVCMQSIDMASEAIRSMLFNWLHEKIYTESKLSIHYVPLSSWRERIV